MAASPAVGDGGASGFDDRAVLGPGPAAAPAVEFAEATLDLTAVPTNRAHASETELNLVLEAVLLSSIFEGRLLCGPDPLAFAARLPSFAPCCATPFAFRADAATAWTPV